MKNLCPSCTHLIPRGIIITEPKDHRGVIRLQSPRINGVCLFRNIPMDNISVAACSQHDKKTDHD